MNIILLGDFAQIPPVIGTPLYKATAEELILLNKFRSFTLSKNVRHRNDTEYQELIRRMRLSALTETDTAFLTANSINTRNSTNLIQEELLSELATTNHFIGIFNTNRDRRIWNTVNYNRLTTMEFVCVAVSTSNRYTVQSKRSKKEEDKLEKVLKLRKGCRVILLKNSDTNPQLTNGSLGTVIGFRFSSSSPATNRDPDAVAVKFDEVQNPSWINRLILNGRSQFPLQLGYGITAHKVQCKTFNRGEKILIDCHNLDDAQRYVSFSRVAKFSQLTITNFSTSRSKNDIIMREKFWKSLEPIKIGDFSAEAVFLWNLTDEDSFSRLNLCNPGRVIAIGNKVERVDHKTLFWERIPLQFPEEFCFSNVGNKKGRAKLSSASFEVMILLKSTRSPVLLQTSDVVLIIEKINLNKLHIRVQSTKGQASRLFPWDPNVHVLC